MADHVMLDRRSSGVRERHQRPVTKAHKTEDDREHDAAQCDSGSVRAHGKLCSHGPVGCQSIATPHGRLIICFLLAGSFHHDRRASAFDLIKVQENNAPP